MIFPALFFQDSRLLDVQALLISQRILNQIDPRNPHPFFLRRLLNIRIPSLEDQGQRRRAFNIALLVLEMIEIPARVSWENSVYSLAYFEIIDRVLYIAKVNFYEMLVEPPNDSDPQNKTFASLMKNIDFLSAYVFKLISQTMDLRNYVFYIDLAVCNIYFTVIFLTEMQPQLSMEENLQFSEWLKRFIKDTKGYHGVCNLLHCACGTNPIDTVDLLKMFLQAGSDANGTNWVGDPPIRYLIDLDSFRSNVAIAAQKAQLLVNAGAHLDLVIYDGFPNNVNASTSSPLDYLRKLAVELKCPILDAFINRLPVPLLTCLCAQSIRANRTPYGDKKLPSILVSFLKNHGAN